ncbi:MAG TPA: PBS lyase [Streptomyces sp.]|uniref:PBS lyase n=1 Tax=Streptomyces sp. TaxID=1931 RepID=UPI002D4797CD|nr:PBS lyase [Streptomyces sp.]HZG06122.1 PBS lyase [Streptomyces sp.]
MLEGLRKIDWGSMRHAYGRAKDVPELLLGLASGDPAEREAALKEMYGVVHHQGGVYDSTLACIPFLFELIADPAVGDRGKVIGLIASIWESTTEGLASAGNPEGPEDFGEDCPEDSAEEEEEDGGGDEDREEDHGGEDVQDAQDENDEDEEADEDDFEEVDPRSWWAAHRVAGAAVRTGAGTLLSLVDDADPGVRRAVPAALVRLHDDGRHVLSVLRERLPLERDGEVRSALMREAAEIALRRGELRNEAVALLDGLRQDGTDPAERLTALAQLGRCAPERLPAEIVPTVTGLLDRLHETGASAKGAAVNTVPLLRTLHNALGDRVAESIELIVHQLRSPDPDGREDALWTSSMTVRCRRGSYGEVVELVGRALADPEPRVRKAATAVLKDFTGLTGPIADHLAACVAADPDGGVVTWPSGGAAVGGVLEALARLGDPRAVPYLAAALEGPEVPYGLGGLIGDSGGFGEHGAPLVPLLRRRLAEDPLDGDAYGRVTPLLSGLTALRSADALPEVLRVVREASGWRGDLIRRAALRAVAAFGPAADEAGPHLRALLSGSGTDAGTAVAAAAALWAVEGDGGTVLPALCAVFDAGEPGPRYEAVVALGGLGPAAAGAAPRLRRLLAEEDHLRTRIDTATALWRVARDAGTVLPVLCAAWEENVHIRGPIADCLVEMGAAAAPAAPLLRAELAETRRHTFEPGRSSPYDVAEDEALLRVCRRLLERVPQAAGGH